MRRIGGLFEEIVAPANLWAAWREFRRGKGGRRDVRAFEHRAPREVVRLAAALREGRYRPGGYRLLLVHEPKVRLVAAAPIRDRIVHHALHRVLAPRLDRGLVDTTYACLPGRGAHRAALAFLGALRRHRYVVMFDVRRYFLSVDREILLGLMARRLREQPLLDLLRVVADSGDGLYERPEIAAALGLEPGFPPAGCGLPIGNLTSQWWGNHYLSGLDHFVKRVLKLPHAQRYMDDVGLFSDSRAALEEARVATVEWLARERRLRWKHPDAPVRPTDGHFRYLGFRISRAGVDPSREALTKMRRRLRGHLVAGREERLVRSLASYRGLVGVGADRLVGRGRPLAP